ncbi:hypothetical protein GJ496_001689 [Pomphorhynchus laevis]|nr:hypothetical protein GJ496_001689 [Pomphorhynchus laevis]
MFGLHFTYVTGIPEKYNQNAVTFKDIFAKKHNSQILLKAWLFNYMIDSDWILNELPVTDQRYLCISIDISYISLSQIFIYD